MVSCHCSESKQYVFSSLLFFFLKEYLLASFRHSLFNSKFCQNTRASERCVTIERNFRKKDLSPIYRDQSALAKPRQYSCPSMFQLCEYLLLFTLFIWNKPRFLVHQSAVVVVVVVKVSSLYRLSNSWS